MKNVLLLFTLLFCVTLSHGQSKDQALSNAEKFSAKSGTLISKEFIKVGELKGAKLDIVYFTDLIANQKQSALKFAYESTGKYSNSTKSAILDADEIDGFIKSIKLIQDKIFPTNPTNYQEVTFKSRGGIEAGCFWSKGNWSTYLKIEQHDNDSFVFLTKEDFPKLLQLLETSKSKLL